MTTITAQQIKSIQGKYHFTANDKKYIKQGLSGGYTNFCSPRKNFQINETDNDKELEVIITEYRADDYGRKIKHTQKGIITLK